MNKPFFAITFLALITFTVSICSYAEKKDNSLDAHVHGLSELTIAMEGNRLDIQFESPAMNLVGFEYKATSKKDIATVKNAESLLSQPDALFVFFGADCQLIKTSTDTSALIEEDHHHSKTHKDHDDHHEHNDHDDHHGHDNHEDHEDHEDHDNHKGHDDHDDHESHSEIVADYSYSCKNLSKLSSIKIALFESFSGIHKINAMWVTDSKQGSATVTASNPTVSLR